jgi:glutamate-ammonia-ligase adenylyltransferase
MHADHPPEEIIESILPCSRYVQRLLESERELLTELRQNV